MYRVELWLIKTAAVSFKSCRHSRSRTAWTGSTSLLWLTEYMHPFTGVQGKKVLVKTYQRWALGKLSPSVPCLMFADGKQHLSTSLLGLSDNTTHRSLWAWCAQTQTRPAGWYKIMCEERGVITDRVERVMFGVVCVYTPECSGCGISGWWD